MAAVADIEVRAPAEDDAAPALPGTYVLLVRLDRDINIAVRSGSRFALAAALYAYVGSARGPGGLAARLGRHFRRQKRRHWHVDYLLGCLSETSADAPASWAICFGDSLAECDLARLVAAVPGCRPVPGFGCSDCACTSHLFALPPESPWVLVAALRSLAQATGLPYPLLAVVPCPAD